MPNTRDHTNPPIFKPGDKIDDRYIVKKPLGSGGFGHVYLTEPDNGIQFAVKQPKKEILARPDLTELIFKEADHWNELGLHPNVAYCYFVKLIDEVPYIFIEYVAGGTLKDWIDAGKCSDMASNLDMAIQLCHGIEHAHNKGMLHRDIKPGNILMTGGGIPKITDFGLSGPGGVLHPNMGSPAYMAPERFIDGMEVNESSDIFSFGICLWEMFCNGEQPYMFIRNRHFRSARTPRELNDLISDQLEQVLIKCVEEDPGQRYPSFDVLRKALNDDYKSYYKEDSAFYEMELPDSLANDLNNRGFSFYKIGEEQKARECWQAALKADPKHLEATFNLGCLKWKNAEDNWSSLHEKLDQTGERSSNYWLCKGWVYFMEGDHEAIESIQKSENRIENNDFQQALENPKRSILEIDVIKHFEYPHVYGHSVCHSLNGRFIALISIYRMIRVWDTADGFKLILLKGHRKRIYAISFSSNGKLVFSGSNDGTIRIWNVKEGVEIFKYQGFPKDVLAGCFSPSGKYILIMTKKEVQLFEVPFSRLILTYKGSGPVDNHAFSPNEKFILFKCSDKCIGIYNTSTGRKVKTFRVKIHDDVARYSPNGKNILLQLDKEEFALYNQKGKHIRNYEGQMVSLASDHFTPNGDRLIYFSKANSLGKRTLMISKIATGQDQRLYFKKDDFDECMFDYTLWFSSGGDFLVSVIQGVSIHVFDVSSGRQLAQRSTWEMIEEPGYYTFTTTHPFHDKTHVFYTNINDLNKLWELRFSFSNQNLKVCFPLITSLQSADHLLISNSNVIELIPSIETLLAEENNQEAYYILQEIRAIEGFKRNRKILDLISRCHPKGRLSNLKESWYKWGMDGIQSSAVSFSKNSDYIIIVRGYSIEYRDINNRWDEKHILKNLVIRSNFSTDDTIIFLWMQNDNLLIWDISQREVINTFEYNADFLPWYPSRKDSFFYFRHFEDELAIERLSGIELGPTMSFSPDGRVLVESPQPFWLNDPSISLMDVYNRKCSKRFNNKGHLHCVSPDGSSFLTKIFDSDSSLKQSICLFDLHNGKKIRRFQGQDSVSSLCFSPDGRFILSSGENKIRLWDCLSGKSMVKLTHRVSGYSTVHFSNNSRFILSLGNQVMDLWELDWELEFPDEVDWHVDAEPYVNNFLTLYRNQWTEEQFDQFYQKLQYAGLGWIRKEGVLNKMKELAASS